VEWKNIQSNSGRCEVKVRIEVKPVGVEVAGVPESVARGADGEVLIDVGGHLEANAQRRNACAERKP
jgi:hypothetical protein